jgi:Tfp pilus assembly protein PilV
MRPGFTFLEVLCILLVIVLGLAGVLALVNHGMGAAARARGASIGLATAVSIAKDARPLLDPNLQADWTYADYTAGFDNTTSTQSSSARGFINGFYVVRTETSAPQDVIARAKAPATTVYMRSANVSVDVFETIGGALVASYTTRILRQRGTP